MEDGGVAIMDTKEKNAPGVVVVFYKNNSSLFITLCFDHAETGPKQCPECMSNSLS